MERRALRSNSNSSSPATQGNARGARSQSDTPVTLNELKAALTECVAEINEKVDAIVNERLERLRLDIRSDFEDQIKQLDLTIAAQAKEIEALKAQQIGVAAEVDSLAFTFHQQMKKDIARNIVISGIKEDEDEDELPTGVHEVLEKLDCAGGEIVQHSRVGKSQNNKPRLLKISFRFLHDKIKAVRNASNLRADARFQGVYVNSDFTFAERQERKRLRDKSVKLKNENPAAEVLLRRGNLLVDGDIVDVVSPHRLLFRPQGPAYRPKFNDSENCHLDFFTS